MSAGCKHKPELYKRYKDALVQCRRSYAEDSRNLIAEINEHKAEIKGLKAELVAWCFLAITGWGVVIVTTIAIFNIQVVLVEG